MFPYDKVKEHCNVWFGDGDIDESGAYVQAVDVCDDWQPMGDPGHGGRLTYGPAALCPNPMNPNPNQTWTTPCPGPYVWGESAPAATSRSTSRHRPTGPSSGRRRVAAGSS